MKNETFAFEIERFYGHFVNELKLTNKSKYTIISYNTTIKSFIAFIREYEKPISFENLKKIDIMNFLKGSKCNIFFKKVLIPLNRVICIE